MRTATCALLLLAACATPPAPERAVSRVLPAPDARASLSPEIRARLLERMDRHGSTLDDLVWAVVLLDRDSTATLSTEIALWQSAFGDLDPDVPLRFVELEKALRSETDTLGRLARDPHSTDDRIGESLGRLAATCVACHATYLYGDAETAPARGATSPFGVAGDARSMAGRWHR